MRLATTVRATVLASLMIQVFAVILVAQVNGAPDRRPDEGEGPFDRLIIRGVYVIDGTGAPPFGPADIVIAGNRIESISVVGTPNVAIDEDGRPSGAYRPARWLLVCRPSDSTSWNAPPVGGYGSLRHRS